MPQPMTKTFRSALPEVFAAAQRAVVASGYKIDSLDRNNGLINFKTGLSWRSWAGQEMSVMLIDNANGTCEVSITGRRNQSGVVLQVYDWGEVSRIATAILDKMNASLAVGHQAQPPMPQHAACATSPRSPPQALPASQAACPHCQGVLSYAPSQSQQVVTCPHCRKGLRLP